MYMIVGYLDLQGILKRVGLLSGLPQSCVEGFRVRVKGFRV